MNMRNLFTGAVAAGTSFLAAGAALAQEATNSAVEAAVESAPPVAEAVAAVPNPGNNAWMMTATVLVLLMICRGWHCFMAV